MDYQKQDRVKHKKSKNDYDAQNHKKKKYSRDRSKSRSEKKRQKKHRKQRNDSKDKQYQKSRQKQRSRQNKKYKSRRDSYSSQRHHKRKYDRNYYDRDYDHSKKRRDRKRQYKDNFRFDSPPKSDQSRVSQDPEQINKLNQTKAAQQLVNSKTDRKLYLGNLPPNITSPQLMQMLNSALKKMDINTQLQGDSIISAWISPDGVGHYAFVQFRSAQQATNALALNGASLYGYQLKLGRPKQYIEYNKQLLSKIGNDGNLDQILKNVASMGGDIQDVVEQKIIYPPSRIIILKHILTIQELAIDEQYQEILYDITDMAKRYGTVLNVVIPRPHQIINIQQAPKRVKGLGYAFIQYEAKDQATKARKEFVKKMFSERSVACSYFDQKRFRESQLDVVEKVIIDF